MSDSLVAVSTEPEVSVRADRIKVQLPRLMPAVGHEHLIMMQEHSGYKRRDSRGEGGERIQLQGCAHHQQQVAGVEVLLKVPWNFRGLV